MLSHFPPPRKRNFHPAAPGAGAPQQPKYFQKAKNVSTSFDIARKNLKSFDSSAMLILLNGL
jgi:hypothetical protein